MSEDKKRKHRRASIAESTDSQKVKKDKKKKSLPAEEEATGANGNGIYISIQSSEE
jgi:hypothetical protein